MAINPDRIKLMDEPWYTPRVDIYDKEPNGPVVQMGVTLKNFTGDVYIKAEHLKYIAGEILEMESKEVVARLIEVGEERLDKIKRLNDELEALRKEEQGEFNQRLDRLFAGYSNNGRNDDSVPPVADDSTVKAEGNEGKSAAKNRKTKEISLFDE